MAPLQFVVGRRLSELRLCRRDELQLLHGALPPPRVELGTQTIGAGVRPPLQVLVQLQALGPHGAEVEVLVDAGRQSTHAVVPLLEGQPLPGELHVGGFEVQPLGFQSVLNLSGVGGGAVTVAAAAAGSLGDALTHSRGQLFVQHVLQGWTGCFGVCWAQFWNVLGFGFASEQKGVAPVLATGGQCVAVEQGVLLLQGLSPLRPVLSLRHHLTLKLLLVQLLHGLLPAHLPAGGPLQAALLDGP